MDLEPLFRRRIHPGIARAAQYCLDLAATRELPRRSDLRPSAVRSILGNIFLIDVGPEPTPYFFKLFGSHMTVLYGADLTGKNLDQFWDVQLKACLRSTYDTVVAERTFQYVRGQYKWTDRSVKIERLLVPMVDDEGRINTIFGVSVPDVSTGSLHLFAGSGAAQLKIEEILGPSAIAIDQLLA